MMISCVVGSNNAEVDRRLARWRAIAENPSERPLLCGTTDEVATALADYAEAGVGRAMLQHLDHEDLEAIELFGQLAKAVI